MQFKRVLCPVDFSDFSVSAYDYALTVAEYYKAHWVALDAVELLKYPYADYVGATGDFAALSRALCDGGKVKLRDLASTKAVIATRTQELDRLIPGNKRGNLKLKTTVRSGKPYEEIVRHAGLEQISLITMTVRGGDALDRAVFGSTTYRVIQLGPCPVLAVHT